jgi:hypothetical protein
MKSPVVCAAVLLALAVAGCAYSFTGASVPPHLKTVAIPLVEDLSGLGEPGLREKFTTEIIQLFTSDNSLEIADRGRSDSILEGAILTVTDAPAVVAQGEQVTRRRVTVNARFAFQDMKLRKKMWDRTFSNWGEYDSGGGLSQRQAGLQDALKKIAEDVLLETVSGW